MCGVCNYECSYCIQSPEYRVGHPTPAQVEGFLRFFGELPGGAWEIKMTGGEPFAFKGFMERIVPGLVAETAHTVSVLTNYSGSPADLGRVHPGNLVWGRLLGTDNERVRALPGGEESPYQLQEWRPIPLRALVFQATLGQTRRQLPQVVHIHSSSLAIRSPPVWTRRCSLRGPYSLTTFFLKKP